MKYFMILFGVLFLIIGLNLSLEMISSASTIENLLGIIAVYAIIVVLTKTKFFTNLNIKKDENEKN